MSTSCKLFVFYLATLVILSSAQIKAKELCVRPKENFDSLNHLHDYVECLKMQTVTRYGKRSFPTKLLGKIRPDLYNHDYNNLQQLIEMMYDDK